MVMMNINIVREVVLFQFIFATTKSVINLETVKSSIFVIIPCYNEASVIRNTVAAVVEKGYTVIIVDDNSKDNTKKQLNDLPVYYLRHRVNMGQGAALQTGIDFAIRKGAKYFVTFDADGQHDINDIPGMMDLMNRNNADIIFGSRFLPGSKTNISRSRTFALNLGRYISYIVSGILLTDSFNGLRLLSANAAKEIIITENRNAHPVQILMLTAEKKLEYAEYPVSIQYSDYSRAKGLKNWDGIKIIFEIILNKLFS
jgi:glycosyltransferase involved in cell wall biosynthesis